MMSKYIREKLHINHFWQFKGFKVFQPFTSSHQYASSPYSSLYISRRIFLQNNQELLEFVSISLKGTKYAWLSIGTSLMEVNVLVQERQLFDRDCRRQCKCFEQQLRSISVFPLLTPLFYCFGSVLFHFSFVFVLFFFFAIPIYFPPYSVSDERFDPNESEFQSKTQMI